MARLPLIDFAQGEAHQALENAQKVFGKPRNIFKTMAHSPLTLQGFLDLCSNLSQGKLSRIIVEKIALTIAAYNHCFYCMAAHNSDAKSLHIEENEIKDSLKGYSSDPKTQAVLKFARAIADKRGHMTDQDFEDIQNAGYSQEEMVEIFAQVMTNLFANYFNNIFLTSLDFPEVTV